MAKPGLALTLLNKVKALFSTKLLPLNSTIPLVALPSTKLLPLNSTIPLVALPTQHQIPSGILNPNNDLGRVNSEALVFKKI